MKRMQHGVRSYVHTHPYVAIMVAAVMTVSSLALVETSDVLPLEGQATPMYGPLKTPGASSRASSSARSAEKRVTSRRAAATSQASLRGAAPSSAAAKAWTGNECASGKTFSDECAGKVRAAANGDMACFLDEDCYDQTYFCRKLSADECSSLKIRRWAYDAFFPGCATDECSADVTVLASPNAPKALRSCLASPLCRELLADFRRGEFACRRYEPCLDALAVLTQDAACISLPWCTALKTIDERYTKYAFKCSDGPTDECKKAISIDAFASKDARRVSCERDDVCRKGVEDTADALAYGSASGFERAVGCFLWPQCKKTFESNMRWACETVKREPDCGNHKAIHGYLTKTRPACVFGYTKLCKAEMEALLK